MFEIGQVPPQIITNGKMAGTGHQNGGTNGHVTIQEVSESSEESDEDYEPEPVSATLVIVFFRGQTKIFVHGNYFKYEVFCLNDYLVLFRC